MSDLVVIGRAHRDARKSAQLSQIELAELIGVSDQTGREAEKGTGRPSIAVVDAMARALGARLTVTL